jgi:hypothetical protein
MEPFRTIVSSRASGQLFSHSDRFVTVGSCFSDAIGNRLLRYKVRTLANPFGNIYNPHSIHKVMHYSMANTPPAPSTYLESQGIHLNYDFHSEFSSLNKPALEHTLKHTIESTHSFLKNASWLIITYGTAWVYERISSGELVANCHKQPANDFSKLLLTQKKIIESFEKFHAELKGFNPAIRIILTVSPVRHIKDTLELNSVSKAVLRLACHTLKEAFPDVDYFPSYEIMMDDLRDYRFYKPDMLHPSGEAEEYIWQRVVEQYADKKTQDVFKKWQSVLSALSHKPFHPTSEAHQKFLKETLSRLEELKSWVNVEEEMEIIKQQMVK